MTDLAPSVAHRFCVGLTSAFRRCVAVGVVTFCSLPPALADEAGNSPTSDAEQLVSTFHSVCAEQVESRVIGDKSHLNIPPETEIAALAAFLRRDQPPDAVWGPNSGAWYQVQRNLETPEKCEFVSSGVGLEALRHAWVANYGANQSWRTDSPPYLRRLGQVGGEDRMLLGGTPYYSPHGQAFLLASATGMALGDQALVHLIYAAVGRAGLACELWPEACS